jgi:hypothetical protein
MTSRNEKKEQRAWNERVSGETGVEVGDYLNGCLNGRNRRRRASLSSEPGIVKQGVEVVHYFVERRLGDQPCRIRPALRVGVRLTSPAASK